jgi:hypothetical protein
MRSTTLDDTPWTSAAVVVGSTVARLAAFGAATVYTWSYGRMVIRPFSRNTGGWRIEQVALQMAQFDAEYPENTNEILACNRLLRNLFGGHASRGTVAKTAVEVRWPTDAKAATAGGFNMYRLLDLLQIPKLLG